MKGIKKMIYDVLIVGAGPAGIAAAIYAKRANLNLLVFEGNVPGGQLVNYSEIENYPGTKTFSSIELATDMLNHLMTLQVEVKYEKVNVVNQKESQFELVTDYDTYLTKSVIIATGNEPRRLGVENEDSLAYNGISWCAICDGPIYKGKDVVVVGGGNSAVEEAQYLASFTNSVTVIQNLDKLTAEASANQKLMHTPNVTIHLSTVVDKFLRDQKGLTGVVIKKADGSLHEIKADGVFEYVGMRPVTDMVKHLGVTTPYGYIQANAKMETAIKGLYACGDVTEKQIRQVITAAGDGAVAAQNVVKYIESLH